MSRRVRYLRRRARLFERQGGKCFWCARPMSTTAQERGARPPDNMLTLDHLDDRLDPMRGKRPGERTVAACWECNQRRCRERIAALPIEEKWRLGRRPKGWTPPAALEAAE